MEQLQKLFEYEGRQLRTVIIDGELWFVAKDVCEILEIANSRDAIGRLDEDEKGVVLTDTPGGRQEVAAVNEPGLYALVLGSRKPEAKSFKRWITHEVIPVIRKTGTYTVAQNNVVPLSKEQALVTLLRTTADLVEGHQEIIKRMDDLEHKVDEQITIDSGEQRTLQKAIAKRVYELESDPKKRRELFRQLHREIRDRWAVPSYRDVRRTELEQVLKYIDAWWPRVA
jgi:prophage antirepressor-like protein